VRVAAIQDTERLLIRPWTLDDAEVAFLVYGDAEVTRFLGNDGRPQESVQTMREALQRTAERNAVYKGRFGSWALFEKESGEIVGAVLLKPLPGSEKIEVGWHLARKHWGKGYATESAREAIRYGFEELGLEAIYAVVYPENARSLRVCERLGMKYGGVTADFYEKSLCLFSTSTMV
jgi:[ribosomal protein S5]-alanine N-acetyltransferase